MARLTGWWHHQQGGPSQRWTPQAWKRACDASLEKSQMRRGVPVDGFFERLERQLIEAGRR